MDLNDEEILGTFYEKGLEKANQKDIRIKKVTKKKRDKLCVQWKGYDNSFDSCIDKKRHCIKMRQCFPKQQEPFGGGINVKVDLKIKYLMLVLQPKKKKQSMMKKYQKLNLNMLPQLNTVDLKMKNLF